jgi:hypothetical protein
MQPMNNSLNLAISGTAGSMPRLRDSILRVSITPLTSICCGQRVVQVWHEAQSQIARLFRTALSLNCTLRMTWCGARSNSFANGQPLEHLMHW